MSAARAAAAERAGMPVRRRVGVAAPVKSRWESTRARSRAPRRPAEDAR